MPAELGKAVLDLGVDSSGLTTGLSSANTSVSQSGASIARIGATVGVGLGAAIGAFAVGAVQVAGDFQSSMNRVKAVSGATEEQFTSLGLQAKELGATTQFSASQAADAMGFLAQAGFNADEVMGAMPGTLNLAAAAQIDLATSADIASNVLSGYGIEVEGLGHVNDVLVSAMTKTNTDLLQLGEAMKYAAPVAASAGVGLRRSGCRHRIDGQRGHPGFSMAGTSLRGAISRLISPTDNAAAAMNHAGLSFLDAEGRLKPFDDVVRQLEPHAEDTGLMMELFGQRAGPAMSALVSQGADALTDLTGELINSGGTAEDIAEVQMEGLNGAIKLIKSAFEALQIAVAEAGLIEFATAFIKKAAAFISWLAKLDAKFILVGLGIVAAGAAAGALLLVIPTLVSAVGTIKVALVALQGATGIGLVLLAIGALVTAFVVYRDEINNAFAFALALVTTAFDAVRTAINSVWTWLGSLLDGMGIFGTALRNLADFGLANVTAAFDAAGSSRQVAMGQGQGPVFSYFSGDAAPRQQRTSQPRSI